MKKDKKQNKSKYNFGYDFLKVTGFIPAWLWVRPKIIYLDKSAKNIKGGVLVASNHVTFIDPIILHCALMKRRLYCVATKEVCSTKIRKFLFTTANCILIDKQNVSIGNLRQISDALKQEKAVVIFPESSINHNDGVKEYKSGFVLMSVLSKKPILPVCIIRRDKWYKPIKVVIGEPVDASKMCSAIPTMEEMEKVSEYLREKELEMLQTYS